MAGRCTKCGTELEPADHGGSVCTHCGDFSEQACFQSSGQSDGTYCNLNGIFQSDLATSGRRDFKLKAAKRQLPKWKTIISNGGDALRLTTEIVKGATQLFEEAYNETSKEILLKKESYKRGLCAGCLHVACQRNAVNIGVTNIWEAVQADGPAFHKAMKDLKRLLDIHVEVRDRFDENSIEVCLKKYGIEAQGLKKETLQIVRLAEDSQVHTGCKAEPLILAAAFIAWQNSTPNGFKTSIKDFNIKGGSSILASIKIRLSELRKMLEHMVKKISWIDSASVKPKEAVKYLKDIIQYQESEKLTRGLTDSDDEETGEKERMHFKPKRPKKKHKRLPETVHPNVNTFLTDREGLDLNSQELNEKDIPDSEMHHYIYIGKSKPTLHDL